MWSYLRAVLVLLCVLICSPVGAADDATSTTEQIERQQAELDARIGRLIAQLGSPEFPVRERAKLELARLGLSAFDALHEAQFHADLEVSLQARYLVRSAQVAWVRDDDGPEVKSLLKGYGDQTESERATRIERLSHLENRQGWSALCRLARYERDESLSKQAALAVMKEDVPPAAQLEEVATVLRLGAGDSRRRAAQWLRAYARWLREPETILSEWNRLLNEEFELLNGEKDQTSMEVVKSLARWHADTLRRLGHEAETKGIVKKLASLLDGDAKNLLEHVDWLGHREMWSYITDTYARYETLFDRDAMLLYLLAEAQLKLGDKQASETAARALALNDNSANAAETHVQAGYKLSSRGLFDWCETEYRAVLENEELASRPNLRARFLLSETLHDQQKEKEAALVLEPVVNACNEKAEPVLPARKPGRPPNAVRDLIDQMGRDVGGIESRMHYFFALDDLRRGEVAAAQEHLEQGAEADGTDADVIIALYRLPNQNAERREETRELIRSATDAFQEGIVESTRNLAQLLAQAQNESVAAYYRYELAKNHNQLAWLVANTEGDFEAAVASSHESLKLRPGEAAYLDTLGRCYYANGDLANAIKYQAEAVRKEPHSQQMSRQLAAFRKEAEKK